MSDFSLSLNIFLGNIRTNNHSFIINFVDSRENNHCFWILMKITILYPLCTWEQSIKNECIMGWPENMDEEWIKNGVDLETMDKEWIKDGVELETMDKEWIKNGWAPFIAHHHATHLIMPRRNMHCSGETRIARCHGRCSHLRLKFCSYLGGFVVHLSHVKCDDPAFIWTHKVGRHTSSRRMK